MNYSLSPLNKGLLSDSQSLAAVIKEAILSTKTYQLYFGRNMPNGEYVNQISWDSFKDVLNFAFNSYTVQDCEGVWKGELEDTKLVTVTTSHEDKVTDVCQAYTDFFNQDAVGLRVTDPMRFVTKTSLVY